MKAAFLFVLVLSASVALAADPGTVKVDKPCIVRSWTIACGASRAVLLDHRHLRGQAFAGLWI